MDDKEKVNWKKGIKTATIGGLVGGAAIAGALQASNSFPLNNNSKLRFIPNTELTMDYCLNKLNETYSGEMTAKDVVERSTYYAFYFNEKARGLIPDGRFSLNKLTVEDMCAPIYLANIDYIGEDEKQKLIDAEYLSDNAMEVLQDSLKFYAMYETDTINRINNNDTDIYDLSLLMGYEKDRKYISEMDSIIKNYAQQEDTEKIAQNYNDLVKLYNGISVGNSSYIERPMSVTVDANQLNVGTYYTLSHSVDCIKNLAKSKGISDDKSEMILTSASSDYSGIVNLFNSEKNNHFSK